jgi:hypothetical protein
MVDMLLDCVCLQAKDVRVKNGGGSGPVLRDVLRWQPLDLINYIDHVVLPYHAPNIQMLRAKLVKLDTYSVSHISGVMLVAYLIMGWSRPAFSAEPSASPDEPQHLQLAPINIYHSVGGYLGYIYNRLATGATSSNQQTLYVGVNGNLGLQSFFWQPWFAQINANLSANVNSARTSSSTAPTNNAVNTYITTDTVLNVLRKSRFPFKARVYRQDNRSDASYSGFINDMVTTGYGLMQFYTSQNRRLSSSLSFDSNKTSMTNNSPFYTDTTNFDARYQLTQFQSITLSGNAVNQNQPGNGKSSSFDTLVANHLYRPNSIFSVASLANLFKLNSVTGSGTASMQQLDNNSGQFNSFASLRPEKTPLTITSSIRFMRFDSSTNGIPNTMSYSLMNSTNFNLGANYLFSPLIRLYGSVNVQDIAGIQTVTTTSALTAARQFRAITNISGYRYSGALGGSLSSNNTTMADRVNHTTTQTQNQNLGLYLSHTLDKSSSFGSGTLTKNLSQTVSTARSTLGTSISTLATSGSLSLHQWQDKHNTDLRLSAFDSRNLGGRHHVFQMINLQAISGESINNDESLQGNLTVQAIHTEYGGMKNIPNTISPNAQLLYRNSRAFKVRRLTFESLLRVADSNIAPTTAPGFQNSPTRAWENNFFYSIGLLSIQLKTRVAIIGNYSTSNIQFSAVRSF